MVLGVGEPALAAGRSQHLQSSRVGILDTADMAANTTDSASHEAPSTDHTVASTANIAATANTADTDTGHPNMDRSSRDHKLVLVRRGCLGRAKPTV